MLCKPTMGEHADNNVVFVAHVWPEPDGFAAIASVNVTYAEANAI